MTLARKCCRNRASARAVVCAAIAIALPAALAPAAARAAGFTAPRSFPAGDGPRAIAAGDFDGDGDLDLVAANEHSHDVSVLLGEAGGSFAGPVDFAVAVRPTDVAVGDFNADGDLDLAVTSAGDATFQNGSLSVLLGSAGGSFGTASIMPAGGNPRSLAIGEFSGDTDPDLAIAEGNDGVHVMLGGEHGTFGAPVTYPTADSPADVAVADFNADLDPDLALPNNGTHDVSVLYGATGSTFTLPTNFAAGNWSNAIDVGDFNGDNDPDLAVAHWHPGGVSVLLGGAAGTFGSPSRIHNGAGNYTAVAVGDLNGDADPDLVAAGGHTGIDVLLGGAGGSFGPAVTYQMTTSSGFAAGAVDVVIGDVNGDGDPDIAVANSAGDAASVLLNRAHPPQPPTFIGTEPVSPANQNAPKVRGSAPAGTMVRLYATADCSGEPVATGSASEFAAPGLALSVPDDSTTTLRATATNAAGVPSDCSTGTLTYVEHSSPPAAALAIAPNPVVTGAPVTFDASGSTGFGIVRFEWDLDGDGSFEVDTGPASTTTRSFAVVRDFEAGVRVTNDIGSSVRRAVVSVRLAPPPGALGVSINGGAQFTNDARVSVGAVWPPLTRTVHISNDGGFALPGIFPVAPQTPWQLDSSGPERLPKTIYVRFDDSSQTFTDDIILDETAPQVTSATASPAGAGTAALASAARTYTLRITARDRTSGVRGLHVTSNKRRPGKLRTYRRTARFKRSLTFRTASPRIYVRAQDAAGNYSRWRSARRARRLS